MGPNAAARVTGVQVQLLDEGGGCVTCDFVFIMFAKAPECNIRRNVYTRSIITADSYPENEGIT